MPWKNLKWGKYDIQIFPLTFKMPKLPDCTPEGKLVTKIRGVKSPDKYMVGTEEVPKPTHKLVNEKSIAAAQPTKAIPEEKIEKAYSTKLIGSEMTYLIKSGLLQEQIEKEGPQTASIVTGRGWKCLRAVMKIHEIDGNKILIMEVGRKLLKEINIQELLKETQAKDLKDQASEEDIQVLAAI